MSESRQLSAELARHRRHLTGEYFSTADALIARGLVGLSRDDLELTAVMVSQGYLRSHLSERLAVPEHIRRVLLPDALNPVQQELEAAIVEASARAVNHLRGRSPLSSGRPAQVFRSVIPLSDHLVLKPEPIAAGPLLAELLPFDGEGGFGGIAGLRARSSRNHVELSFADQPDSARVLLSGVSQRVWKAAMAFVAARRPGYPPVQSLEDGQPPDLTNAEEQRLNRSDRVPGPVRLASGLLRRIGTMREAAWVGIRRSGCNSLGIEWSGDAPIWSDVAILLANPMTGLPGARLTVRGGSLIGIVQSDGLRCPCHPVSGLPELVFHSAPSPMITALHNSRPAEWVTPPEWVAWHAAINR